MKIAFSVLFLLGSGFYTTWAKLDDFWVRIKEQNHEKSVKEAEKRRPWWNVMLSLTLAKHWLNADFVPFYGSPGFFTVNT